MDTFNISRHFVIYAAQICGGPGSVLETKNLLNRSSGWNFESTTILTAEVYPSSICSGCKWFLYSVRIVSDPEEIAIKKEPYMWRNHSEDNCPCRASMSKGKGRLRKISKQPMKWKATDTCGSETESGEDNESEQEKSTVSGSVLLCTTLCW